MSNLIKLIYSLNGIESSVSFDNSNKISALKNLINLTQHINLDDYIITYVGKEIKWTDETPLKNIVGKTKVPVFMIDKKKEVIEKEKKDKEDSKHKDKQDNKQDANKSKDPKAQGKPEENKSKDPKAQGKPEENKSKDPKSQGKPEDNKSKDPKDGKMCPVYGWASVVSRIVNYPIERSKLPNTPVNTVYVDNKFYQIPGELFVKRIREAVSTIGIEKLGFGPDEVGNHSPRSAGAMALFLGGTPVYAIMLQGRWSSDAFMRYIRKEVLQASVGLAQRMLSFESFYTAPAFTYTSADGDLRTRNTLATNFNGSHDSMRRGSHPAFHLE